MQTIQENVITKGRQLPEILIELVKSTSFRTRRGFSEKELL